MLPGGPCSVIVFPLNTSLITAQQAQVEIMRYLLAVAFELHHSLAWQRTGWTCYFYSGCDWWLPFMDPTKTLLLASHQSPKWFQHICPELKQILPNAELVKLISPTHWLHLDLADEFNKTTINFIKAAWEFKDSTTLLTPQCEAANANDKQTK